MKKGIMMAVGCALLLTAAPAAYSGSNPYLSLNGGVVLLDDVEVSDPEFGTFEIESDPGLALAGALGYKPCHFFRMETEVSWQQNDMDKVTGFGLSADIDGDTNSLAGLLNGYYDFATHGPLTPFLSAGIGAAKVEVSVEDESWDDTAFAYQVGGGLNFVLNPKLSFDLKYRYFSAADLDIDGTDVDYSSHNIYGGLRIAL